MTTDKLPWFPFYWHDWRASNRVRRLTPAQRAAYLELLMVQWDEGSIPATVEEVRLLLDVGYADVDLAPMLDLVFPLTPEGFRVNERLGREREAGMARYRRQVEAADRARSGKKSDTPADPSVSPNPSPNVSDNVSPNNTVHSSQFTNNPTTTHPPTNGASRNAPPIPDAFRDWLTPDYLPDLDEALGRSKSPRAVLATLVRVQQEGAIPGLGNVTGLEVGAALREMLTQAWPVNLTGLLRFIQNARHAPQPPRQRTNAAEGHSGPVGKWNRLEAAAKVAEGVSS